ncbi:hypothetical protein OG948_54720 (plasmid) [Embleya sp. NBC_00888]|uniref:hypothetical protein n=1 Tax=Embleya sp. NBC_00888 TaxID=2975960 RepID=UPI00386855F0|nr:hypothetical protein OG948_54720 [Embleya sp. NBC_00888]
MGGGLRTITVVAAPQGAESKGRSGVARGLKGRTTTWSPHQRCTTPRRRQGGSGEWYSMTEP